MTATLHSNTAPILAGRAADRALRLYLDARAAGRRLAWAREATGISQAELAAYVGVSQATISRVEHGERAMRPTERAAAARALGCSIATLAMPAIALPAASNGNGRAA
jgi:DNA-binding XRE family transcriptional regulator